jgi:uncharacterized protein (TIGR02117 family)
MKRSVRKIIRVLILVPVLLVSIYFFAVVVGAMPTVIDPADVDSNEYQIFFTNNKYHVEICLPAVLSPFRDEILEARGDTGPDRGYYCFGWGERTFYPETPFLEDINFFMAVDSLFTLSKAAVRISFYDGPIRGEIVTPYQTNRETVELLYEYVNSYLEYDADGSFSIIPPETVNEVYGDSLFINAGGRYSFLNTCNNWTANAMKYAGIKTGLWTPFAWNVLKELE